MSPLIPPPSARQEAWDTAAQLAADGLALPVIVSKVVYAASPRIDQETGKAIPARGRTFWVTMATAMAWMIAVYLTFLFFDSTATHAVAGLKVAIYLGVLVFAVGFGIVASNDHVRERRTRVRTAKRAEVERIAQDAAQHVWSSEVPGVWRPLGPAPVWATVDSVLPTAWWRRFGGASGTALPVLVDGSEPAVRGAIAANHGVAVVFFVREPGTYGDRVREWADVAGIGLFVVGRAGLVAMSSVATAALRAYQRSGGTDSPAEVLLRGWLPAGAPRSSLH